MTVVGSFMYILNTGKRITIVNSNENSSFYLANEVLRNQNGYGGKKDINLQESKVRRQAI